MILAWNNRGDLATLSAGSEISTLPGSNVQQEHLSQQWHTATGVKSSYVIFDLGSALSCSIVAVLGTNLTSSATIRIRASTADPTVVGSLLYDSTLVSAGVNSDYGAIYKSFDAVSARYWRLDLADATVPDNLEIGRVFLGPKWTPTIDHLLGSGAVTAMDDDSKVSRSYGGQSFPDERPQARVLAFELGYMTEDEMFSNAFALARAQGVVRDVLAIPDIASTHLSERSVFGLCQGSTPLQNQYSGVWQQKFTIRERL